MNKRLYNEGVFNKALEDYMERSSDKYCYYCYSNNLEKTYNHYAMSGDYRCLDCSKYFSQGMALSKQEMRNFKINDVLK